MLFFTREALTAYSSGIFGNADFDFYSAENENEDLPGGR